MDMPRKLFIDRVLALIEVLLLTGLLSSLLAVLPFFAFRKKSLELLTTDVRTISLFLLLEAGITMVLLMLILKAHRETLRSLGLRWERWRSDLITGLGLVPFLFLINAGVSFAFRTYLPKYYTEKNPLTELIHSPQQLGIFIFSALVAGGLKEELQRAFILNRFGRYLGGSGLGLVLWSLVFGAGHYVQGVQGIVIATIYGFVLGATYLLSKSLVPPFVAHGAYDALALVVYWFSSGRFH